ncbi:MAG: hypothetical protein RLZ98_828 [Pseudomonadota bacterium]|jgi:tripartite-type tricarboxylate transporter receptor subunit TctC
MLTRTLRAGLVSSLALAAIVPAASADDFYKGKQLKMLVGSGVGGGYDAYARLMTRHWGNFIPGKPTWVVQNMPGAGSLKAMNYLAISGEKDGTTVGQVQTHIGIEPMLGVTGPVENMKYDGRKMQWLGSASKETPLVVIWHESPVKTFQDAQKGEVLVGSSGVATSDSVYARVLNTLAGTKFRVVEGYKNLPELSTAMEKGEVAGRAGWFWSSLITTKGQWVDKKQIRILAQVASEKNPALPDVPLATDFIKDPAKRAQLEFSVSWLPMGRPFVAPAGVPADRVAILRKSFMDAIKSDALQAEAKKMRMIIDPMSGEEVQALVEKLYKTPKETVEAVKAVMIARKKK